MAGKPVGTIYAELDLDISKYTAAQKKILYDSQTMAINVENSWKVLGQKSDIMYTAMRKQAENAYQRIASDSKSSAAERVRAEEAMHSKIKQLNEQQFGHQTSLLESIKKNWMTYMAVVGTITAAIYSAYKVYNLAKVTAEFGDEIERNSRVLGINSERYQELQYMAMRSDVQVTALTMGIRQLTMSMDESARGTGEGAKVFKALGISIYDSTGKMKTLDLMLGDLAEEFSKFRDGPEKSALALKLFGSRAGDQLIPYLNQGREGLEKLRGEFERLGLAISEDQLKKLSAADEAFERFGARLQKLKTEILVPLVEWMGKFIDKITEATAASTGETAIRREMENAQRWMDYSLKEGALEAYQSWEREYYRLSEKLYGIPPELLRGGAKMPGEKKTAPGIEDTESLKKTLDDEAKAWGVYADIQIAELEKLNEYKNEATKTELERQEYARKKIIEGENELEKIRIEAWTTVYSVEEDIREKEKKLSIERIKLEADIYEDIRGYDDQYHEAQMALIADRVKALQEAGVSEVAIAVWTEEETRKATEKKILQSNNFFAGMRVQMDRNLREQMTWAEAGASVFKKFTADAQGQLSDNLFNFMTLRFDKLSLDWNSLWEGMLRTLTDKIAEMAVTAAAAEIFDWFDIGWIFAAEGIWKLQGGGKEGIPIIGHPGEMIIPADLADQIRGMGGDKFSDLQGMIEGKGIGLGRAISMLQNVPATILESIVGLEPGSRIGYSALSFAAKAAGLSSIFGIPLGLLGMIVADQIIGYLQDLSTSKTTTSWTTTVEEAAEVRGRGYTSWGFPGVSVQEAFDAAAANAATLADVSQEAADAAAANAASAAEYGGWGGGVGGEFGFKRGGIARGPESGYWARLHGTEEVIPLKNGNDSGREALTINSPLIVIEGNLIADRQAFDDFVEKIDYAINKRAKRAYSA